MDYEGKIDGVAFEGGTAQGQENELSEDRFIPGFVDGIVGMSAGETKDVEAKFPDPYSNADLAGKDAVFTITVHEVKEPELPELDDELAKRVSRTETLADLRAEVKRRLDETVKRNARRHFQGQLLDKLVAANDFPLPDVLVERELDLADGGVAPVRRPGRHRVGRLPRSRAARRKRACAQDARPEAERRVKTTLLVEAIAKKEGIVATQEDVENELAALSRPVRPAAREDHRGAAGQRRRRSSTGSSARKPSTA